jgi:outer membrane protein assembly factor BamB
MMVLASSALADWPTWRADARRSATTDEPVVDAPAWLWTREYPPLEPAWPDAPRLEFDIAHQPIAAGGLVFVASSRDDSVTALDAETGEQRWRFHAGGPVRFAPTWSDGRLFFACDDGYLYALRARDGVLIWRRRGGPAERWVVGNGRLVSSWPARGAPVVVENTVYFGASIWPFMGVFVHALDVSDGAIVWTNDSSGSIYISQPHNSPAFGGIAPQGYFAAYGDALLVPNGRSTPACLDRLTGALRYFDPSRNSRTEDFRVAALHAHFVNGDDLQRLRDGGTVDRTVVKGSAFDERRVYSSTWQLDRRGEKATRKLTITGRALSPDVEIDRREFVVEWTEDATKRRYRVEIRRGKPPRIERRSIDDDEEELLLPLGFTISPRFKTSDGSRRRAAVVRFGESAVGERGQLIREVSFVLDRKTWTLDAYSKTRIELSVTKLLGLDRDEDEDEADSGSGRARFKARIPSVEERRRRGELTRESLATDPPIGLVPVDRLTGEWTFVEDTKGEPILAAGVDKSRIREIGAVTIRAGKQIIVGVPGEMLALTPPPSDDVDSTPEPKVDWRVPLDGIPVALIASGGRLIVSFLDGRVACWGERSAAPPVPRHWPYREAVRLELDESSLQRRVLPMLQAAGHDSGFTLVLGADRDLVEGVVLASKMRVVVLDSDEDRGEALRRRLDRHGWYGSRVVVRAYSLSHAPLPPYLASVVLVGRPDALGVDSIDLALEPLARVLRPWGGAACLRLSQEERERLDRAVADSKRDDLRLESVGDITVLRRVGPPLGGGSWTHQYGDAANTNVSTDSLVRAPLGVLWFGGPSNVGILPRHGHGPRHQVVGGRIVIEGPNILRALDVYTGRKLWESHLPGIGAAYDNTSHQPGSNSLGGNFVSTSDAIYVALGDRCARLAPETGKEVGAFRLSLDKKTGQPRRWGYMAVSEDLLVVGGTPMEFSSAEFDEYDGEDLESHEVKIITEALRSLKGFRVRSKGFFQSGSDWIVKTLNQALDDPELASRVPEAARQLGDGEIDGLAAAIDAYKASRAADAPVDETLRVFHRRLLHFLEPTIPGMRIARVGAKNVWDGTASRDLVVIDRQSGEELWTSRAERSFRHNAICVGGGKVFVIDRLPDAVALRRKRRGRDTAGSARLVAFDLRSGREAWSATKRVSGTFLSYSKEHDVLVASGRPSRDMLPDEKGDRLVAYRGSTGEALWDVKAKYSGPVMLWHDRIIAQGNSFHLLTGKRLRRVNPLTGAEEDWAFSRMYGCTSAVASEHLLTFRSAAAGYFDLSGDGGTANLGGFRSSCTQNLIVADGVLTVPDYTRTCSCSYPNQSSIGLIHAPELELWTFNLLDLGDRRVDRLGLNFGAPGDRRTEDGILWLEYPIVGGPTPAIDVEIEPKDARLFRSHSSRVEGDLAWVGASGFEGVQRVRVRVLSKRVRAAERRYRVRLVFAEPSGAREGQRVFDVVAGERVVLKDVDVARASGGARRVVVRSFEATIRDRLDLRLVSKGGDSALPPILSGLSLEAMVD